MIILCISVIFNTYCIRKSHILHFPKSVIYMIFCNIYDFVLYMISYILHLKFSKVKNLSFFRLFLWWKNVFRMQNCKKFRLRRAKKQSYQFWRDMALCFLPAAGEKKLGCFRLAKVWKWNPPLLLILLKQGGFPWIWVDSRKGKILGAIPNAIQNFNSAPFRLGNLGRSYRNII